MTRGSDDQLTALRAQIDDLDRELVELLARRFEVTREVGRLKAQQGLPSLDEQREFAQRERLCVLASGSGVDPDTVLAVFDTIVARVRAEHDAIRRATGDAAA